MKLEPFTRQVQVFVADLKSPQARSKRLAAFAGEEIEKIRASNRAATGKPDQPPEIAVDGRKGAPLASVKPDGVIVAEFDLVRALLDWVGEALLQASPVRSGRFARSFLLLADDVEIRPGADVPEAEEYVLVNTQPYARKIERGLSPQAPDGVFDAVSAIASRRFGNVARVRFGYRSIEGHADLEAWATATNLRRTDRKSQADRNDWLRRQPAVIVRPF